MSGTILIYGRGKVGHSLGRFCDYIGHQYVLADDTDGLTSFDDFEAIIPSPGIPPNHRIYQSSAFKNPPISELQKAVKKNKTKKSVKEAIKEHSIPIISELDFLFSFIPKGFQIHCVTGTDGKSTTSWILYHFLRGGFSDASVYLGGNFGMPLADIVRDILIKEEKTGHIILEVSSFMAYYLEKFLATNSIITNLHPDHLDWHRDIQEYYYSKFRLLSRTGGTVYFPESVSTIFPQLEDFATERVIFPSFVCVDHDLMTMRKDVLLDVSDRQLLGEHNLMNIYMAGTLALDIGVSAKTLSTILPNIPPLPHRLQKISDKGGRIWIDDSKSTTAQSLYAALRAFSPQKVHLIAGGKDKGDKFENLRENLREHCQYCVAIGETRHIFLQACHDLFIESELAGSMAEAVNLAFEHSNPGDVILLSPGCSSFDMFRDYEDRSAQFLSAIHLVK